MSFVKELHTMNPEICHAYKFFPSTDEESKRKLLIDDVGVYSISTPKKADIISRIISDNIQKKIPPKNVVITDAMAGVGGNVISFSKHFRHVNAIEVDEVRFKYMINNVNTFSCHNVTSLFVNYISVFTQLQQDVIFIDPPWGGRQYKKHEHIDISVDNIALETLCERIIELKLCSFIVLKLPKNYRLELFSKFHKTKTYDLNKMVIVLIYC